MFRLRRAMNRLFNRTLVTLCVAALAAGAKAASPPITALAFSPDGALLLTSGYEKVVVRSVKGRSALADLKCHLPRVSALSFSPRGRLLAVAGGTPGEIGQVEFFSWNPMALTNRDRGLVFETTPNTSLPVFEDLATAVSFSPDGTKLAVASADHTVDVLSIERDGLKVTSLFTLLDHSGPVLDAAFSPNGHVLVTASADRSLKVWDATNGKLLRTFSHHTAIVHCVAFKPMIPENAGAVPVTCASGSDDKTVRVWQPQIGRMVRIVRYHDGPILALAYSQDGAKLFSAGSEGVLRVIDAESDTVEQKLKAHDDWIYALALSPDGRTLASGDWAGTVKLWDVHAERVRPIDF